jgi:hypothetical protein
MKKMLLKITLYFIITAASYAQGFDWQFSPRLPFKMPVLFLGAAARYDALQHFGDVNYIEGVNQCAVFSSGKGNGFTVGGYSEYWHTGYLAITGGLLYSSVPAVFLADGDALPLASGEVFKTEYEFSAELHYVTLEAAAKYRLFDSHFFSGGGIQFGTRISQSTAQKERVVSPAEGHFNDNSQERIFDADITGFSRFTFAPQVFIGYDLPVGLGYYLSPTLRAGASLNSLSDDASWRNLNFSVGLALVKGVSF